MISDMYDSVVELFKHYGCPAPVYLGEQYATQHTETMCVVMWQTSDQFAEAVPSAPSPTQTGLYINPRPLKTRRCGLKVRMWAKAPKQRNAQDQYRADLAWLDALVNQFCIALNYITAGINELQGGVAAAGNASAAVAGLGYDLTCLVDVPIIDAKWPAQALDKCTETWQHMPATAEITISGKVDPEPPYYQPGIVFPVPTATE